MEHIVNFLKNDIAINWISPIVVAAIIGIGGAVFNKIKEQQIGIPHRVHNRKDVDVFGSYCKKNKIQPIISYGDSNAFKIISRIDQGKIIVSGEMDLRKKPENNEHRKFVMICLKYIPKCNMTYFYKKGYSFMFDIRSEKGICGLQLEIKDTKANKVINEYLPVTKEFLNYSFKINEFLDIEAWKEINEICFTVFLEDDYVYKTKGNLEIKNCFLKILNT